MSSKSPSCHDEDKEKGNDSRGRVFDEIQREAEEELHNSSRILNSAENSLAGGTRGSNYCSKNTSRACSRGGSGQATREGSPDVRSGLDPSGVASCEPSRPSSRYVSEASRQGISQATTYFKNFLKTGSPLEDYPHDFISQSSRLPHQGSTTVRFVDLTASRRPLSEPSDFHIRPSLHIVETCCQAPYQKKSPEIRVGKKLFDDGNFRSSIQLQKSRLLSCPRTVPYKNLGRNMSISRDYRVPYPHPMRTTDRSRQSCLPSFAERKVSLSPSKKSFSSSRTSIKSGCLSRVNSQLKVRSLPKKNCSVQERSCRFVCAERPPSIPRDICPINQCVDPCAPVVDSCRSNPPDVLIPAPLRSVRKPVSAGKGVSIVRQSQHRGLSTKGTTQPSKTTEICVPEIGAKEVKNLSGLEAERQREVKSKLKGPEETKISGVVSGKKAPGFAGTDGVVGGSKPLGTSGGTAGIKGVDGGIGKKAPGFAGTDGVVGGSKPLGTSGGTAGIERVDGGIGGGGRDRGRGILFGEVSQKNVDSPTPQPLGKSVGFSENIKFTGARDDMALKKNVDEIRGTSNYIDEFADKSSPNAQGSRGLSGVTFGPSRYSVQPESWTGSLNRSPSPGKNTSIYNEPSSGIGAQSSLQGSTKLASSIQGAGSTAQKYGSSARVSSTASKTPSRFVEDSDLGTEIECPPKFSKSHSHYTQNTSHVSECPVYDSCIRYSNTQSCAPDSHTRCSKSPSRIPETSSNISKVYKRNAEGSFLMSPIEGDECPDDLMSNPNQEFENINHVSEGSGYASERFASSSHPTSIAERGAPFSQASSRVSRRSPEHISDCAVHFSDGSDRFQNNLGQMPERMAQYSGASGQFSQRSPGHVSERAADWSEAFDRHSSSPTRLVAESSAPDSEFAAQFSENHSHFSESSNWVAPSSARFTDSPARISEHLGIVPESPTRQFTDSLGSHSRPQSYGYQSPISPSLGTSSPYPNPNSCSGKALKCLTRINADPNEKRKSRISYGENLCDFVTLCDPSYAASAERKLPKKPDLSENQLQKLIQDETDDIELTRCITADDRISYKKPCPKQTKAQMQVKHLIHSLDMKTSDPCPKEYGPLVDPDPEDISPEVAAAMMFSQEKGIRLESCPAETIKHLFPDQKSPCDIIPGSKISIVDSSQKDQEEMIEKSASVPSEGVSDSAYTKTMKNKSDDMGSKISYELDFDIGQSKREYVVVSKKPQRFNKIQYRGNDPSWFPGYFSAFPDDRGIKIIPSPSTVFNKAWMITDPSTMPASDVTVID